MNIEKKFEQLKDNLIEIKIIISKIETELRNFQINRSECKHFLNLLYTSFYNSKDIFLELTRVEDSDLKREYEKSILFSFEEFIVSYQGDFRRSYTDYNYRIFTEIGEKISKIAKECDSKRISSGAYFFDNSEIKNKVYSLISAFKIFIERINNSVLKPANKGISETFSIKEFIFQNPLGLDINWVVSVSYLSAIEILTITKRQELGLVKDKKTEVKLPFDQKLDELIKEVAEREKHLDKKMLGFQKMLRDFRTQVIHYGYIPDDTELGLIIEYSNKTLSELSKIKI